MPKADKRTGIVHTRRYADHCTGPDCPERPERQSVLEDMLDEPEMRGHYHSITPRPAEKDELLQVHSEKHIHLLESTRGRGYTYLGPDVETSPFSHEIALLAAGGFCRAIELVISGQLDNAIALIRPPGHHAERSKAQGFCLYNNVAVGVRFAQNKLGLERILVADWDLHHGNGTQHCFEDDPSVLFFSVHQSASYPGSGNFREIGKGRGKGRTTNIQSSAFNFQFRLVRVGIVQSDTVSESRKKFTETKKHAKWIWVFGVPVRLLSATCHSCGRGRKGAALAPDR